MPTNNPNYQSSSQAKGSSEGKSKIESGLEQGGQRAEKAIERLEKGAEQVASTAINRVREVREQATSGITQQRDMVAHRIRRLGEVLHGGGEMLAEEDAWVREALGYVSQRANRLADYVSEVTPGAVADDLQSFARRRPGVFFGGAFLIGLSLGRFAKSTTSVVAGGGGGGGDVERYGEDTDEEAYASASYASAPSTTSGSSTPRSYAPQTEQGSTSSTSGTSSSASTSSSQGVQPSTSLPYVAAGNSIGATPSSASYGASTSKGTIEGTSSNATSPSYGTSVGGTGGYGGTTEPASGSAAVARGSQPPSTSKTPSATPSGNRPQPVKPGEGSKS